jgi:hypothetical protein
MFLIPCMNKVRRDFPHHFLPLIGVLSLCITRLQTPLILLHGTCGDDQEERQQTATASPSSCLHAQAITPSSSTWTRRVRRAGPRWAPTVICSYILKLCADSLRSDLIFVSKFYIFSKPLIRAWQLAWRLRYWIFLLSIPTPCDLHNANLLLNVAYRTKHNTYVRPNILSWGGKSSNLQLRWAPCVHHVLPWWRWRWCSALFWFRNLCLYATKLRLIHFLVHWIFSSTILYCTWYLPMEISLFSWHVDGLMPRNDIEEPFYLLHNGSDL